MSQNSEYKLILIGNAGVGKTSIFRKLSTGEFTEINISTIGVEKKTFSIDIENKKKAKEEVNVILFDTAGQEKFRSITKNYYKGSDGVLLIYDITDKNSFEQVESWINSIRDSLGKSTDSKYIIFLIGNKLDLINDEGFQRQVTEEQALEACQKFDMIWGKEHSTKDIEFEELNELFVSFIQTIYNKVGEKKNKKQTKKKLDTQKRGCCESAV